MANQASGDLMNEFMAHMTDFVKACKSETKEKNTTVLQPENPQVPVVYFDKNGKATSCMSYQVGKQAVEAKMAQNYSMGNGKNGQTIKFKFS